jgi:uncharacterized membrane protein YhaH (DUF805 family)
MFFGFRGRLGRTKYFIGLAAVFVALVGTVGFAALAMSSTGSGGLQIFAIPLFLLALWIFAAVTIKRLRDTALPRWTYALFIALPLAWIPLAIELAEASTLVSSALQFVLFIVPGLLSPKAGPLPAAN